MFLCQVQHSTLCNTVLQLNYYVWINWELLTSEQVQQTLLLSEINLLTDYVVSMKRTIKIFSTFLLNFQKIVDLVDMFTTLVFALFCIFTAATVEYSTSNKFSFIISITPS